MVRHLLAALALGVVTSIPPHGPARAQDATPVEPAPEAVPEAEGMTLERLADILGVLDTETERMGLTRFQLTIADVPVMVVTDPLADRMRAMVPIRATDGMTPSELMRVMSANFDTALDARYAVARGVLWGVYIHPLSPLEQAQLISGIGQAVNLALTYGSSYSSGGVAFMQGDSADAQRKLIEDLLKRGEEL